MAISIPKTNQNKLAQMPSKLRKAIGAVKDQTSISFAKVVSTTTNNTNTINLEIPILKATSHDESPIDTRYLLEILSFVAASRANANTCAQAVGKRVGKTRNWAVALKSLMLVLRIFQHGDPHFPKEVRHIMKTGTKILNLSNFKDDSSSKPWDYTSFVRALALYLDERLDCLLSNKLHRLRLCRRSITDPDSNTSTPTSAKSAAAGDELSPDTDPATLTYQISYWQKLLDRAMATRPTGEAKANRLVQSSVHAVVQESFDLYHDISDGLAILLDGFFQLPYQSCVTAFQACVRASKQFEELSEFYHFCKSIGVGRTSEYPSVQKISDELMETLQEFLRDQATFPSPTVSEPVANRYSDESETSDQSSDRGETDSKRYSSSVDWELSDSPDLRPSQEQEGSRLTTLENLFDEETMRQQRNIIISNPFLEQQQQEQEQQEQEQEQGSLLFVAPTFCARNSDGGGGGGGESIADDPFDSMWFGEGERVVVLGNNKIEERESLAHEQQLWLENQKKIIAKLMA